MSKFGDALRTIGVYNNFGMLVEFGQGNDVAVEYHAPAAGRAGWGSCQRTLVWHPSRAGKEFLGPRRESWPAAMKWVAVNIGGEFVPSPFGGYLPKTLIDRAKSAVKAAKP